MIQKVDSVKLGTVVLENIDFQFGDLENSFGVQGIIGNNVLDAYKAIIDYESFQLSLRI